MRDLESGMSMDRKRWPTRLNHWATCPLDCAYSTFEASKEFADRFVTSGFRYNVTYADLLEKLKDQEELTYAVPQGSEELRELMHVLRLRSGRLRFAARIINRRFEDLFMRERQSALSDGKDVTSHLLVHGTISTSARNICRFGIQPMLCKRALFGDGSYWSPFGEYSATFSPTIANSCKVLILGIGMPLHYCVGKDGQRQLPLRSAEDGMREQYFDSFCNDSVPISAFVFQNPNQIVPVYVIVVQNIRPT